MNRSSELHLRDLVGDVIVNIGTVRRDADGDDMIYFYLQSGLVCGADRRDLWAHTEHEYDDVFVDFTDFLEEDSPLEETDWQTREGDFLLLADFLQAAITEVFTARRDGVLWVYLGVAESCCLAVPLQRLIADGPYRRVWTDAETLVTEQPRWPFVAVNGLKIIATDDADAFAES